MSDQLTAVTIAQPTFWYIDPAGVHRYALRGQTVEVNAEDLARGEKYGSFVTDADLVILDADGLPVDPGSVVDEPASDKVKDIEKWVAGDPARAQEALTKELEKDEDDRRSSLVAALEKLTGAA